MKNLILIKKLNYCNPITLRQLYQKPEDNYGYIGRFFYPKNDLNSIDLKNLDQKVYWNIYFNPENKKYTAYLESEGNKYKLLQISENTLENIEKMLYIKK